MDVPLGPQPMVAAAGVGRGRVRAAFVQVDMLHGLVCASVSSAMRWGMGTAIGLFRGWGHARSHT